MLRLLISGNGLCHVGLEKGDVFVPNGSRVGRTAGRAPHDVWIVGHLVPRDKPLAPMQQIAALREPEGALSHDALLHLFVRGRVRRAVWEHLLARREKPSVLCRARHVAFPLFCAPVKGTDAASGYHDVELP